MFINLRLLKIREVFGLGNKVNKKEMDFVPHFRSSLSKLFH
jgi:hypothetical protein